MSQEENEENINPQEAKVTAENLNQEEISADLPGQAETEEFENLPIESIGSYARTRELLVGEGSKNPGDPASEE
jgi:hypothetical protein